MVSTFLEEVLFCTLYGFALVVSIVSVIVVCRLALDGYDTRSNHHSLPSIGCYLAGTVLGLAAGVWVSVVVRRQPPVTYRFLVLHLVRTMVGCSIVLCGGIFGIVGAPHGLIAFPKVAPYLGGLLLMFLSGVAILRLAWQRPVDPTR